MLQQSVFESAFKRLCCAFDGSKVPRRDRDCQAGLVCSLGVVQAHSLGVCEGIAKGVERARGNRFVQSSCAVLL